MVIQFDDFKMIVLKNSNYIGDDGWFFPGDIVPHSTKFKYACKKYYKDGLLDRMGDSSDRWGYQYKILNQ